MEVGHVCGGYVFVGGKEFGVLTSFGLRNFGQKGLDFG